MRRAMLFAMAWFAATAGHAGKIHFANYTDQTYDFVIRHFDKGSAKDCTRIPVRVYPKTEAGPYITERTSFPYPGSPCGSPTSINP